MLGYRCFVYRSEQPDGDVIESFEAVELGRFPIKNVVTSSSLTVVTEPTAIGLGIPSEGNLVRNDDWPIDFSGYEKRIAQIEPLAQTDQNYAKLLETISKLFLPLNNNDRLWVVASTTTTYSAHRRLENSFEIVS